MRHHLIKTIEDNKVKIAKKKEEIQQQKDQERQQMLNEQQLIKEEKEVQERVFLERKHQMKDEMTRQLKAQAKKAEDQ